MAKISNSLTALSSAAILAVYAAGFHRTSAAADRFANQGHRDTPDPAPVTANFVAPAQALPSFKSELAVRPESAPKRPDGVEAPKVRSDAAPVETAAVTAPAAAAVATASIDLPPISTPSAIPAPAVPVLDAPSVDVAPPPPPPPLPAALQYKDGTYTGWGSCRHGDIQASVVIEAGRIASATIAQCYTRYPCTWIANAPGQVVARQSTKVDYVSGATQSIDAFKQAVAEALSKAK